MKQKFVYFAVIILLTFSFTLNVKCQWVQTQIPPNTGPARCITVSGSNLFVGSRLEGVFLSTDNGVNWNTVNNGLPFATNVYALSVSGSNLVASTNNGVYLTTDNAANWVDANTGIKKIYPSSFAVDGLNLFGGTDNGDGVFISKDNGANWISAGKGLIGSLVNVLAVSGKKLFAAGGRISFSIDDGSTWTPVDSGLPGTSGIFCLAFNDSYQFAGTGGDGIFRSTIDGNSWSTVNLGLPHSSVVYSLMTIGSNLFAGTYDNGLFFSTNYGKSWTQENKGLPKNTTVYAITVSGTNLFVGTDSHWVWRRPLSDFGISGVSQPKQFKTFLYACPNPFNNFTKIDFSINIHSFTQVSIHNLLGSEVARLFSGTLDAGEHSFTWDAHGMPAGMYVCIVKSGGEVKEIPLVLVK